MSGWSDRTPGQLVRRFRRIGSTPALKGTISRVILVRDPVPGVFREAVFLLHERYLEGEGVSREALLREAKRAALEFSAARRAPRRSALPLLLLSHLLCAALGFFVAWLVFC